MAMNKNTANADQKETLLPADHARSHEYSERLTLQPTEEKQDEQDEKPVRDHFNLVWLICLLLGSGILIAYNFLVSAPDYYFTMYPDKAEDLLTLIVPVYTVPEVIFLILSVLYGHLFSFTSQLLVCFLLIGVAMFFPLLTAYVLPSKQLGFYVVLTVSFITGITTAVIQCTVAAFCNYLPVSYIQISVAGQAMAGVMSSVLRIAVNLLPVDETLNGIIYFGIGGVVNILCGLSFLYAIRSAFVKFHLEEYFLTRKYRGTIEQDEAVKQDPELLQRTDTQTILRKLVDDSVATPTSRDFEAVTHHHFPDVDQHGMHRQNAQIIGQQRINPGPQKRKSKRKRKRKRTAKEKKLATSMDKQQNTYMRMRENTATQESSEDESQSDLTTDDEDEETVEITKSVTVNSTVGSINSATTDGTVSGIAGAGSAVINRLNIPILAEEVGIDDVMQRDTAKQDAKHDDDEDDDDEEELDKQEKATFLGVLRKIKLLALALFLVFFGTFLPFPAFVTTLKSQSEWINNSDVIPMPVLLVLEYNVSDFIGRNYIASWTSCSFTKRTLWIGCAWRIVLYPVYVLMYTNILFNDIAAFVTTALLGLSNGAFCCLCFMWAPSCVTAKEQQLCGSIMSLALVLGITLGSNITLLLTTFVPGMGSSKSGQ